MTDLFLALTVICALNANGETSMIRIKEKILNLSQKIPVRVSSILFINERF